MVNLSPCVCLLQKPSQYNINCNSADCLVVLIAVSNRAVRTRRRHLGPHANTVLSLSKSRPTLQTPVSPFQLDSSRELTLLYIPLSWVSGRIDHLPSIAKTVLIEIKAGTSRGPAVARAAGVHVVHNSEISEVLLQLREIRTVLVHLELMCADLQGTICSISGSNM